MAKKKRAPRAVAPRERAEANAAKRAARLKAVMHCQCCDRAILANTGVIAHHGYQRPGIGWQTASCMGARHLPFEVDRERLSVMIDALKRQLKGHKAWRAKVFAEEVPITLTFADRAAPKVNGKTASAKIEFTRENFNVMMEKYSRIIQSRQWQMTSFDEIKKRELTFMDLQIKRLIEFIANRTARFDGWKKTHEWSDKTWKATTKPRGGKR